MPLSGPQFPTFGMAIKGYEIHMGNTSYGNSAWPLFLITSRNGEDITVKDGAMDDGGRVWGPIFTGSLTMINSGDGWWSGQTLIWKGFKRSRVSLLSQHNSIHPNSPALPHFLCSLHKLLLVKV